MKPINPICHDCYAYNTTEYNGYLIPCIGKCKYNNIEDNVDTQSLFKHKDGIDCPRCSYNIPIGYSECVECGWVEGEE